MKTNVLSVFPLKKIEFLLMEIHVSAVGFSYSSERLKCIGQKRK